MKWLVTTPRMGDVIRIACGEIHHYGIYVSDGEVIQFGLAPTRRVGAPEDEIEVLSASLEDFCFGAAFEVACFDGETVGEYRSPDEIVRSAREAIGRRGYHLLRNNCEHFAFECARGVHYCSQTDSARALFRAMTPVDVYIAAIPEAGEIGLVASDERNRDIEAAGCEAVRREKYFVWRLLEYALERSFHLQASNLIFRKEANGKWNTPECEFSLSHSDGALAVAVSKSPVGIDIERVAPPRFERFAERVLSEREQADYYACPEEARLEYLIGKWTAKEALFKAGRADTFAPSKIDTAEGGFTTQALTLGNERYVCTVATSRPDKVRMYTDVDLSQV